MRADFELYRAFPVDVERNRDDLKRGGKLTMLVLALPGAASAFAPFTEGMLREVAKDVTFRTIERANHWVPEENAKALVSAITDFLQERLCPLTGDGSVRPNDHVGSSSEGPLTAGRA